jgi:hypothetical protein
VGQFLQFERLDLAISRFYLRNGRSGHAELAGDLFLWQFKELASFLQTIGDFRHFMPVVEVRA